jgi:hypothetical protein
VTDEQAAERAGARGRHEGGRESWLWANRFKLAFAIAIIEGLVVAFEKDFSRITVIVIAIPVILFYLLAGRTLETRIARDLSWILAMSQALAVVAAILAVILSWIALVLVGVFAAIGLYLLLHDRPDQAGRRAK